MLEILETQIRLINVHILIPRNTATMIRRALLLVVSHIQLFSGGLIVIHDIA